MANFMKSFGVLALLLAGSLSLPLAAMEVNGLELQVEVSGSGNTVLLFESGFGMGPQVWQQVVAGLPAGVVAVRYARAGVGKSAERRQPSGISQHLADLATLAAHFGTNKQLILVGHSYGGLLVSEYARQHASRLHGVLLIDPAVLQQRHWFKAADPQAIVAEDQLLRTMLPPRLLASFEQLNQQLDQAGTEVTPLPSDLKAILLTSTRIEAEPVAFVETAAGKALWLKLHQALFAGVKNGNHQRIPQLGHNMMQEDPALVLNALKTLL